MRRRTKRTLLAVVGVVAALLAALGGAASYMLGYALQPERLRCDSTEVMRQVAADYPWTRSWLDSLRRNRLIHDTVITAADGDRHHARYIRAPKPSARTALLLHGYTDRAESMLPVGWLYQRLGYNLLLPDAHAHGDSDGQAAQMGWLDRLDVLRWIAVADTLFALPEEEVRMVVHGISMGGAMTMMVSGEKTPPSVRCFVEDCGYTSAWDEFAYELREQFGLPAFPLMQASSALCRLRFGWSFGQADAMKAVARCPKPMLFIHGDADTYVPFAMLAPLYAAKGAPKERYVAPGSRHAQSYHDHPADYMARVKAFTDRYVR